MSNQDKKIDLYEKQNLEINAASKYRYKHSRIAKKYKKLSKRHRYGGGRGSGDCWDNSARLYNHLNSAGQQVRIIQYRTSYSPRHRSVQVLQNGGWVDYNYKGNGYARRYDATNRKPGMRVIK
jgi:N-acetylmuramoyl-L-alanine amidase